MGITKSKQVLEVELGETLRRLKEVEESLASARLELECESNNYRVLSDKYYLRLNEHITLPLSGGIILGVIGLVIGCIIGTLL